MDEKRKKIIIGVILAIIVIILLLCLKFCSKQDGGDIIGPPVINNCEQLMINNIDDLENLLARADLCSEEWFEDLERFITDLEEQINIMKNQNKAELAEALEVQETLLSALKGFREVQDDETLAALEAAVNQYREAYTRCMAQGR